MGLMSFLQSMLCSSSRKEDSPEKTVSRNPFGDEFKDTEVHFQFFSLFINRN